MSEQKARDIIQELGIRDVCGESVKERLGRRAWTRPRVAVSNRLYKQYRVPDPWDPEARSDATPIGLGPVSLRLGEKRREPAPHLKPKPPKAKKKSLAEAARSIPRPPPKPKVKPKPVAPKAPSPDAALKAAKRAEEDARAQEIAERMRKAEAARGKWVRAETTEEAETSPVRVPLRPDAGDEVRVRQERSGPARPSRSNRSDGGRFRMQSRKVTAAPVVTTVVEGESAPIDDAAVEPPESPPPRTRVMPSASTGSMDDMFAAAAQMGRLSLRQSEKDTDSDQGADD